RTLRDVLGEVLEEERAQDRDVEHALVVRHDDVRGARPDGGGALDQQPGVADAEDTHERPLERPGHLLLRPLAEQARDALRHVEHDQGEAEHGQEDDRRQPGQERPHRLVAIGRAGTRLQTRRAAGYERGMGGAPVPLEGWYTLHEMWTVDWGRWNGLAPAERDAIVTEATTALETLAHPDEGHSACFELLTQKGDLCLMHWRRDLEALRRCELALARTRLREFLAPTYSYLAVIEPAPYEPAGHASAMVRRRGLEPGAEGFDAAVAEEMQKIARPRLYPEVPPRRYCCFYPMSK